MGNRQYVEMITIDGVNVFKVNADPNGVLVAPKGSLAFLMGGAATATAWMNLSGGSVWRNITAAASVSMTIPTPVSTTVLYPPLGPGLDVFSGQVIRPPEDGDYLLNFQACYQVTGTPAGTLPLIIVVGIIKNGVITPMVPASYDIDTWGNIGNASGTLPCFVNASTTRRLNGLLPTDTFSMAFGWPIQGAGILTANMIIGQLTLTKVQ